MKKLSIKKISLIIAIIAVVVCSACALIACGPKADYRVGISQFLQHASLDGAREGFKEELTRLLKEKDKTIKYYESNATGDTGTNSSIATTLAQKNYDLLLGISTGSAQALQGATTKTPILFTSVTDPIEASLVKSASDPSQNGNVTGTSDYIDATKQLNLIKMLFPNKTDIKLGVLYTVTEVNSKVQYEAMNAVAVADTDKNFAVTEKGINDLGDLPLAMLAPELVNCDVIYIPTDNKLAGAMANVKGANTKGIPIVTGAVDMAREGGLASLGVDYRLLGKQTAQMAFEILYNGKKPNEIVFEVPKDQLYVINQTIADEIKFEIPQAVKDLIAGKA